MALDNIYYIFFSEATRHPPRKTCRTAEPIPIPLAFRQIGRIFRIRNGIISTAPKICQFSQDFYIPYIHIFFSFYSLSQCGLRSIAALSVIQDDANVPYLCGTSSPPQLYRNLPLYTAFLSAFYGVLYVHNARGSSNSHALAVCGIPGKTFINIQLGQQLERQPGAKPTMWGENCNGAPGQSNWSVT